MRKKKFVCEACNKPGAELRTYEDNVPAYTCKRCHVRILRGMNTQKVMQALREEVESL